MNDPFDATFAPDLSSTIGSQSGRLAIEEVADLLMEGRSVPWILPRFLLRGRAKDELWRALHRLLSDENVSNKRVDLSRLESGLGHERALASTLHLDWPRSEGATASRQARPIETFIGLPDLPRVLLIDGWGELEATSRSRWLEWVKLFARVAKDQDFSPALCAFLPREAAQILGEEGDLPTELEVHWWMGVASQLDVRAWCRARNREEGAFRPLGHGNGSSGSGQSEATFRARWREAIIPALALDDFDLAARLWDTVLESQSALQMALGDYAHERGWRAGDLLESRLGVEGESGSGTRWREPPLQWRELWDRGAWLYTLEEGAQFHSAALWVCGESETLDHRLWRGQAALMLPFLDEVRREICRDLCARHGDDWPLWEAEFQSGHWTPNPQELEQLRATPYACDWGRLCFQLRNCEALHPHSFWLDIAFDAKFLRNELAHHRPVEWLQTRELLQKWGAVSKMRATKSARLPAVAA